MSAEFRDQQANFFRNAQRSDGGFAGREGESDLYYTAFALRALAVLGHLSGNIAEQAGAFLRSRLVHQVPVIDFVSLLYGASLLEMAAGIDIFAGTRNDWRDATATQFEELRRDDGGYAKAAAGAASSTYQSFLNTLAYQVLDRTPPKPHRLVEFVRSQQRDDGGFVEIRASRRSGTNPTAAAVGLLKIAASEWNQPGALDSVGEEVIEFLAGMQTDEGGLLANTRIPIADLLSTFTGLLTLADLGGVDAIDRPAVLRFINSLADKSGGFLAAAWDDAIDVEYSFYGLGSLGLVASATS